MRNTLKKGFTLIELMIVISIIWILAITLLPQLQWAQARARDAGRLSSINSIEAVLNTYYWDEWAFPASPTWSAAANWCLSDEAWTVNDDLSDLFKWWKAPVDTQQNMTSGTCETNRSYAYYPLTKNWIENNSYLLISDVEAFKKGNFVITGDLEDSDMEFADVAATLYWDWKTPTSTDDSTDAKSTVFAAIN